jgi:hypothetical protein
MANQVQDALEALAENPETEGIGGVIEAARSFGGSVAGAVEALVVAIRDYETEKTEISGDITELNHRKKNSVTVITRARETIVSILRQARRTSIEAGHYHVNVQTSAPKLVVVEPEKIHPDFLRTTVAPDMNAAKAYAKTTGAPPPGFDWEPGKDFITIR